MTGVAGLLLAAGASTRMGRTKQLLPLGRGTLLDKVLTGALESRLDRVVLVLGHEAERIREVLKTRPRDPKLRVVQNEDYRQGLSTSIIAGLKEVEADFDHVMIILADMPRVSSGLIDKLLERTLESRLPLGAIGVRGRRSHPVMIGRRFFGELHGLRGDMGARDLFRKYEDEVCMVEPVDDYRDMDIDTPEDYLYFKRTLESRDQGDKEG